MNPHSKLPVAIVGGGLAGMAAAVALSQSGAQVELFEARSRLGGRAGSFRDSVSGEWVDHCQHVSLGCCANYADFCRRAGIAHLFQRLETLHFVGPDGRRCDVRAARWLPAPLHLASSLLRMEYLSRSDRWSVVRALSRLARVRIAGTWSEATMGEWLHTQRQSETAVRRFWSVVLVSALAETVDNVSLAHAKKVFVDGFLGSRHGYGVELPRVPLSDLYDRVAEKLRSGGVRVHCGTAVDQVVWDGKRVTAVQTAGGTHRACAAAIVAVPWRRLAAVLPADLLSRIEHNPELNRWPSSPISSLHLWFDQPPIPLGHALLIDRLGQWVFRRAAAADAPGDAREHHCQIVISASHELIGRNHGEVLEQVLDELRGCWPQLGSARLLRWRLITDRDAVFSPRPGLERLRPSQACAVPNLFLAGDWTRTGWPATMEGAVRSGYLAAEALLKHSGRYACLIRPEPRTWLTRRLF